MKKIIVEVCACNNCILMGALEIAENIESLKKLRLQLKFNAKIEVVMSRKICENYSSDDTPVVSVNGNYLIKANSETVMEHIMMLIQG